MFKAAAALVIRTLAIVVLLIGTRAAGAQSAFSPIGRTTNAPEGKAMAYTWTRMTSAAPWKARDGAGALTFNNAMYMIGGWNSGTVLAPLSTVNEVWKSTDGTAWTQLRANTFLSPTFDKVLDWEGRHTAGHVIHNGKMWIIGGDIIQKRYQTDVWSSADGVTWKFENRGRPLPWINRALVGYTVFNGLIYSIGGQSIPTATQTNDEVYREVWRSADGITWQRVFTNGPIWDRRFVVDNILTFAGKMWVIGGGIYDTPKRGRTYYTDVWSTADGINWVLVKANAFPGRQYHSAKVFNNRMWVLAGWNGANMNDVWSSADGITWTQLPGTPWTARHAASVWVHNNALYIGGGHLSLSDVWRLTP